MRNPTEKSWEKMLDVKAKVATLYKTKMGMKKNKEDS